MLSRPSSIRVEGLGKRYRLGEREPYRTLRDAIARLARPRQRRETSPPREIWALKDVSFELRQGEVLGIIGRNGAGKSTLLKLLTRITRPDAGRIEIEGRVGALLEVGTGFHPELSGRENIYMNGSILGMTRRDIERKFDEIVAFSGVETFLDTPVKRYSSGMRVRLGFAIAAHLEPEILVIDEVLAVGDAEFQRKCLGRMNEVAGEGRTVLFVSHQMEAIQSLCTRAIWLQQGLLTHDGKPTDVVGQYLAASFPGGSRALFENRHDRMGEGHWRVIALEVHDGEGRPPRTGGKAVFVVVLRRAQISGSANVVLRLRLFVCDAFERVLTMFANENTGDDIRLGSSEAQVVCEVPQLPLVPGAYTLSFSLRTNGVVQDKLNNAFSFEVGAGNFVEGLRTEHAGAFHAQHRWVLGG